MNNNNVEYTRRTFSCGCTFDVVNGKVQINTDPKHLNYNCDKTWELFKKGLTEGIFQLETSLGRSFSKKLKPNEFKHISALTAILRPGCMNAKDDNDISTTEHYCRRKNNEELKFPIDPALSSILDETYQLIIFQESILEISKQIAGFSLQEADTLRKGLGKKLADVIASLKQKFIEGCKKKNLVSEEIAHQLFDTIEASNRYSFNKSHSACYGILTYLTAYIKVHFPLEFFTSWLTMAQDTSDVVALIKESRTFDINVINPDLRYSQSNFSIHNGDIIFGLCNIKKIGMSIYSKLKENAHFTNFYDLLIWGTLTSSQIVLLIKSGALDYMEMSRQRMLFESKLFEELTIKQIETLRKVPNGSFENLDSILQYIIQNHKLNINHKEKINNLVTLNKNPPIKLIDSAHHTIGMEVETLGISLTVSELATRNTKQDISCKDLINDREKSGIIHVKVDELREYIVKKGKNAGLPMAFLKVSDETGTVDCVMWTNSYMKYKQSFMNDILSLVVHKQKDTFIIDEVI